MVNLNQLFLSAPELTNIIGKLIYWMYQGIGSFGWTVVVFTICLKLIVSPFDIWQKIATRKNNIAQKAMQPELERIQKAYASNPQVLQQKQMGLYKAYGYSMTGACLPSILTLVIFFVVFSGFNAAVKYENQTIVYDLTLSYQELIIDTGLIDGDVDKLYEADNESALQTIRDIYGINIEDYKVDGVYTSEKVDELIDAIMLSAYEDHSVNEKGVNKWKWLWVDNVFMPDSGADVVPSLETYVGSGLGKLNSTLPDSNFRIRAKYNGNVYDALLGPAQAKYNKTKTFDVKNWNGYFILPVLSIVLSVISTLLMRGSQPQPQTQGNDENAQNQAAMSANTMKIMNWIMPLMIGVFSIFYSAAFSIYMFFNSLISVSFNLIFNAATAKKDRELGLRK